MLVAKQKHPVIIGLVAGCFVFGMVSISCGIGEEKAGGDLGNEVIVASE